jgi:hypothetical protein
VQKVIDYDDTADAKHCLGLVKIVQHQVPVVAAVDVGEADARSEIRD